VPRSIRAAAIIIIFILKANLEAKMEIHDLSLFLDYFNRVHERTMRVVRCIPPDHVDWSPREGKFTLRELARCRSDAAV
jgi:hypothetical protein